MRLAQTSRSCFDDPESVLKKRSTIALDGVNFGEPRLSAFTTEDEGAQPGIAYADAFVPFITNSRGPPVATEWMLQRHQRPIGRWVVMVVRCSTEVCRSVLSLVVSALHGSN